MQRCEFDLPLERDRNRDARYTAPAADLRCLLRLGQETSCIVIQQQDTWETATFLKAHLESHAANAHLV